MLYFSKAPWGNIYIVLAFLLDTLYSINTWLTLSVFVSVEVIWNSYFYLHLLKDYVLKDFWYKLNEVVWQQDRLNHHKQNIKVLFSICRYTNFDSNKFSNNLIYFSESLTHKTLDQLYYTHPKSSPPWERLDNINLIKIHIRYIIF